jgi:hypothetical protein
VACACTCGMCSLSAWLDMFLNRHSCTAVCREPSRLCAATLGGLVSQRQVPIRLKALLRLKALFKPFTDLYHNDRCLLRLKTLLRLKAL